jgi:flagellar hook-basal body complex protein FliE
MDGLTISNANKLIEGGGLKINSGGATSSAASPAGEVAKSFSDTLSDAISKVNQLQKDSDQKIQELATGKTDDVASVMITAEKADIALRTMVQVRNKIIDAYQEIMKMQV